jgi:hypothetical protein
MNNKYQEPLYLYFVVCRSLCEILAAFKKQEMALDYAVKSTERKGLRCEVIRFQICELTDEEYTAKYGKGG